MYGAVSFSLRSAGVLKAPRSIGEPLCDHATPLGPVPARPRSSAVGVTPVLWKPWSPPSSLTRLSWGWANWWPSGVRASIFAPRLFGPLNVRPSHDISVGLFGGPTA